MSSHEVLRVLAALRDVPVWVGGGWGVDALVGRETRAHRDLDLAIDARHEKLALVKLHELGYVIETDWRPVRVEVGAADERWVDLHPVVFDETGAGRQAGLDGTSFDYPADGFTSGFIGGRSVPCLSVRQQLIFHGGYAPRAHDVADIELLRSLR